MPAKTKSKETKPKEPAEPQRLNRAVSVSDALHGVLDAALRKRGFASRDIIANWKAMAPKPYDLQSVPDRLVWPRGARGAEGATLYLRCAPGLALAISHEGGLVAAAVNRYFGYVLVREVRMSLEPFAAPRKPVAAMEPDPPSPQVERAVADVRDDRLRTALKTLGQRMGAGKHR